MYSIVICILSYPLRITNYKITMSLRKYLLIIGINTIGAWIILSLFVYFINPFSATVLIMSLFYIILFIALFGTFLNLIFFLRIKLFKDIVVLKELKKSIRQSVIFSGSIILVLMLLHLQFLNWWNTLLLILLIIMIELILFSVNRKA